MTQPAPFLEPLVKSLSDVLEQAAGIWSCYQQSGPGGLDAALYDQLRTPADRLAQMLGDAQFLDLIRASGLDPAEIRTTARRATELARRCACTPQGLCFISGEAGLIPRREQHAEFEAALRQLDEFVRRLRR